MLYSLSHLCGSAYLAQADEIRLPYSKLLDFIERYPTKRFLIEDADSLTEEEISTALNLCKGNCLFRTSSIPTTYPFIWKYAATNNYDIEALDNAGASEILISTAPFFGNCAIPETPFRLIPNVAHDGTLPYDPVIGSYLRPEDQETYSSLISILEFDASTPAQEEALFRIYKEGKWDGPISLIIKNLPSEALNPLIPPSFAKMRKTCGQACLRGSRCRACYRHLEMATEEFAEIARKKIKISNFQ